MSEENVSSQSHEAPALIPGGERTCRAVVSVAVLVGLVIGITNIAIWVGEPMRSVLLWPGTMVMRMNTAVAITACAASLGLWHVALRRKRAGIAASLFGFAAAIIGLLTALQDLAHINLHIDTLLAAGTFHGDEAAALVRWPGRMSLNASISLTFLGLALAGVNWEWRGADGRKYAPSPTLAMLAFLPAAAGLIGYLLSAGKFAGLLRSTTILFHTAVSLAVLCAGALALRPRRPPVSRIFSPTADGILLRWMVPGSTALFLALAYIINRAHLAGRVAPGEVTALMLYSGLLLLFFLLIAASKAVAGQASTARSADAARREEENRNRAIVDTAPDAVVMMDANGLVLDWNPAAEQIFGWKREEVISRSFADHAIPKSSRPEFYQGLMRYLEKGDAKAMRRRFEMPALRKDGSEFEAELSVNVLTEGRRLLFVGFIRDIAERKRVEDSLRESEHRFRALAENIAQFAWMTDAAGKVIWFNRRWYEYTGAKPDNTEQARRQKVLHPEHRDRVRAKFLECISRGTPWEDVFPLRGADGNYRWFLSRANPIRNADGTVERWFGTNTDVTDQRELSDALIRAKEHAEEASRAKDNFMAALSHELRTPLTPALMMAAALRHDPRIPEDMRADLMSIERNIGLESRLIDDLLDLTRIARDKLPMRSEQCELHLIIGHAIEIVRDEAHTKRIAMERELKARHSGFLGDPARLQQVFWNLLKNAVKFTPTGGRIIIRTRNRDDTLVVEVCDSGIGFAPDAAERLFRPFEQADRQHSHRFGGLGLGLAIARAVVNYHGGFIFASSDGPNRGAMFTVELPGAFEPPAGLTHEHTNGQDGPLPVSRPLRILLVEDHEPTLSVLSRLLIKSGHTVLTASTVAGAMATAASHSFDALVSDLGLPDGTGQQLMTQLRVEHPDLPGIALSGYGMEEDQQRSREAGFSRHLVKPVEFEQLAAALAQLEMPVA